jgi:YfiH family protein
MPFQQNENIRYFTFEFLTDDQIAHAIFTRQGGTSPAPWYSLNVGGTVGDDKERVIENRYRSFRALGRSYDSLYDVWQVHGTDVVCVNSPRPTREAYRKADIILTDQIGVSLFMRFADCVPILLYDPIRRVIGIAHAGWQGTVKKVPAHAVEAMVTCYGSTPADIMAGIGPSIGPHHYDVGIDVVEQVQAAFGSDATGLLGSFNGNVGQSQVQFDLWSANRLTLENVGVRYVEMSGLCTACHLSDWYSHRAEQGQTGRFGALIGL